MKKLRRRTAFAVAGVTILASGLLGAAPANAQYTQSCASSIGGERVWEYSGYSGHCVDVLYQSIYITTKDQIYYSDGAELDYVGGSTENDAPATTYYCFEPNWVGPCIRIAAGTSNNPLDFVGIGSISVGTG
jgi:hypothetical protein